jgi:hypothetical protein
MRSRSTLRLLLKSCLPVASILISSPLLMGQVERQSAALSRPSADPANEMGALTASIRELQAQVRALHLELSELHSREQDVLEEAGEIQNKLDRLSAQVLPQTEQANGLEMYSKRHVPAATLPQDPTNLGNTGGGTLEERIAKLEEDQELTTAKVNEQSQTKVESGSKYRLRLSGIVLLNMFDNGGTVDNQDFPQIASAPGPLDSARSFGGSLRQSQIGLEAFGPDVVGAHTSADLKFDFAGGYPSAPNGVTMGVSRLRTGTIRLDWSNTSLVAGQDQLFIAPLSPTSLASLAVPALSYAGDLWSWTPQVRLEHRVTLSEKSSLLVQGGILDSLSGELPRSAYYRSPTWGEQSGQPSYAARVSWSRTEFGQSLTLGFGGYYGRQDWGFGRKVDGWTATTDRLLPMGKLFELSLEFYRGRAVGGLGGGIGQTILRTGSLSDPATSVLGLDSLGGWAQLKFKPTSKLEVNSAFGQDNPFSSELYRYSANPTYFGTLLARNQSWFANIIYQPRSDVMFSIEYRPLRTLGINGASNSANQTNIGLGYIF